jgi:hypothetical protein
MFGMHLTHCLYPNLFGQVRVHVRGRVRLTSGMRTQNEWELFTGELVVPENSQVGAVPPRSSDVGGCPVVSQRCSAQRSSPPAWVPADRVAGEGAALPRLGAHMSMRPWNRLLRLRGNVPGA